MDPAVIGLCGALVTTAVGGVAAARERAHSNELQADTERLKSALKAEEHKRIELINRELNAEDVLRRFREPLAAAAFDLQSRCYNIVKLDFFGKFGAGHERHAEARKTTIFRFAQYFGWSEILRREIQFLSFPEDEDTRSVARLQSQIARRLADSSGDEPLMIWADEQRAIGERMIVEENGKVLCMGYARFGDEYDDKFAPLCRHMLGDLDAPGAKTRLIEVQRLLCQLVRTLDKREMRYSSAQLGDA